MCKQVRSTIIIRTHASERPEEYAAYGEIRRPKQLSMATARVANYLGSPARLWLASPTASRARRVATARVADDLSNSAWLWRASPTSLVARRGYGSHHDCLDSSMMAPACVTDYLDYSARLQLVTPTTTLTTRFD